MSRRILAITIALAATGLPAHAAEICGNGEDDDADGLADEGCAPSLVSGVCESPLSCEDTGMVSPLKGSLHYSLPPDISPGVPYGPGIGFRRFYMSQAEIAPSVGPFFQAAGTAASGTGSISVSWPTHQAGDVALLFVETSAGQAASLSSAQGFAAVTGAEASDDSSGGTRLKVFWKRATSSSEASPTVADSGDHQVAQIVTFRGVTRTGDPWNSVSTGATSGTAQADFTCPSLSTTVPRTLLVNAVSASHATVGANPATPDWSYVAAASTTAGNDGSFSVEVQDMAEAGSSPLVLGTFYNFILDTDSPQLYAMVSITLKADATEHKSMGDRWGHTYMTWLQKWTVPNPDQVVVHTNRGQDVLFSKTDTGSGWDWYSPQVGFKDKFQSLKQRTTSPFEYQLRTMTGETLVYDSNGRLTEIWDTLATPNKVLVTYDSNNFLSTVTDASGKRRLLFSYSNDLLSSVAFQIYISSSWTTQHTTSYGYTSGNLTSVSMGGDVIQANTYSSNYLTAIDDGEGNNIVTFAYDSGTAGKVVRVDTSRGMVGFEYNSSRTSCSGKTVLHFNRGNSSSCSVDSDCGSGFLCGGKTGSGSTGVCFRAARCMTVSSPNEDLVTSITALGPPSETCEGTCLDVAQYIWNTSYIKPSAIQDPSSNYKTTAFNANGLPTEIYYGDADSTPDAGTNTRAVFLAYDTNYPGRVTEVRRQTSPQILTGGTCPATGSTTYCDVRTFSYNSDGKLATAGETGGTLMLSGSSPGYASTTFSSTTSYTYDSKGRLTEIDLDAGDHAKTTLSYASGTGDPLRDDFLQEEKRYTGATAYLAQNYLSRDFHGFATAMTDANGVLVCAEFHLALGYLKSLRIAMAGQTDCSTTNSADITTTFTRDSKSRLTKITRPDGSCLHFEYDTKGRLSKTKRRDDCNAASSGDREEYTYSYDSQLTKLETFDASGTVTRRQEWTYFDSRRLEKLINPVDTSKFTSLVYDGFGLVTEVNGGGNLNKTVYERAGAEPRITTERRYRDASNSDAWTLLYDWMGLQRSVEDGDGKVTLSDRDDRGRRVRLTNPDLGGYPTVYVYNTANRLTDVREVSGGTGQQTHSFTYDKLGRVLTAQYDGACPNSAGNPEIQYVYDDAPTGTCPVSGSCQRTKGRLAYVKVTLMCDANKSDKTLDQETWFSYDDAGRLIREHIRDDNSRNGDMAYEWTKNGALSKTTTPSGAVIGATFGSARSNSDTDRVTAIWRTSTSTAIVDNILWNAYGPLKQYNQMNTVSGGQQRTRITRNLAYRITQLRVEKQDGTAPNQTVDISEDAAGRVVSRDYEPNSNGVEDSYFIYDYQDRVLCERTSSGSTCPTDGTNTKNSHTSSPPFTHAGDWKRDLRPIAGSTCMINDFTLTTGTHQIATVSQTTGVPSSPTCSPAYGTTEIGHDSRGNRSYDDNISLTNDRREYSYDARRNLINVQGKYYNAGSWDTYNVTSAFDERNRRVFKSFLNATTGKSATWFFSYDANDRLVEAVYTPDTSASSTYSVFQLFWLGDRLLLYWQVDYPGSTTSRRYVGTDESGRPIDMWSWPSTGDGSRVWTINPRAWAIDTNGLGNSVYQPVLFSGQYQDPETAAYADSSGTIHRPGLALNGYRTYDPFTGSYLQVDPLVQTTWDTYLYASSNPVGNKDPDGLMSMVLVCEWKLLPGSFHESPGKLSVEVNEQEVCQWVAYGGTVGGGGGPVGGSSGGPLLGIPSSPLDSGWEDREPYCPYELRNSHGFGCARAASIPTKCRACRECTDHCIDTYTIDAVTCDEPGNCHSTGTQISDPDGWANCMFSCTNYCWPQLFDMCEDWGTQFEYPPTFPNAPT